MTKTCAGLYMQDYRKKNNLSQLKLAEQIGVRQSTISDIERGALNPSIYLARKLSNVLGISLDDLLSEAHEEPILVTNEVTLEAEPCPA